MSLTAEDLACRRGGREVFAGVSFALRPGDALVLSGPNGSGKSSLLRCLALLTPLRAGRVSWLDRPISALAAAGEDFREIFLFVGHHDGIKSALTVRENLLFASAMLRPGTEPRHLQAALERLGLAAIADRPGRFLSAGQRRRLALARLAALDAPLWLLDEPLAALDRQGRAALQEMIGDYRGRGGVVVASSHGELDMPDAHGLDMSAYMAQGAMTQGAGPS